MATKGWANNRKEIGSRVELARAAAGLTIAELAAKLRLPESSVVDIEAGRRTIDTLELAQLARAVRRAISWFVRPPLPSVVSLRGDRWGSEEPVFVSTLEQLARDVELLVELAELRPAAPQQPRPDVSDHRSAEAAAAAARRQAGCATGPLWDLGGVADRLGLFVFCLDVNEQSFDGAYVALAKGGVALINGNAGSGRRRFTFAHEFGHHFLQDEYSVDSMLHASRDERERLINAFAIHFLAPRESVRQAWTQYTGPSHPREAAIHIACEYGLSWSAACGQLQNLGLVDPEGYEALCNARPRGADYLELDIDLRESLAPPYVSPSFAKATLRAFRRHKLSCPRVLEILRGTLQGGDLPDPDPLPLDALKSELYF